MMKKTPFLLFLLVMFNIATAQNHIVVQSDQHVIYYKYEKENVVFVIEDLKDNEDNFTLHPQDEKTQFVGGPYRGSGYLCNEEKLSSDLKDMCFIEFDANQNGIVESLIDCGYTIPKYLPNVYFWRVNKPPFNMHYSCVLPYYIIHGRNNQKDYEFFDTIIKNIDSRANGSASWAGSAYKEGSHVIWEFKIPWNEISSINNPVAFVRFQIHRVSSFGGKEYYGTFFYPGQNSCSGTTFYQFKLNFSDSPDYQEKVKSHQAQKALRQKAAIEMIQKASTNQPEWDGIYIQLKNGKFVPLTSIPLNIAGYKLYKNRNAIFQTTFLTMETKYEIYKDRRFYFTKDDIDLNTNVLIFHLNEIKGVFVVASNSNSTYVSKANLSIYDSYQLAPDGYEILYPLRFSTTYDTSSYLNYRIQREVIYLQGDFLPLKRLSYPNHKYLFAPTEFKKGLYSFWLEGLKTYMFEIIN